MTRLFISLYLGLLSTLFIFFFVAHLINTYLVIDVENVIYAENFSAEITLLEEIDEHISKEKRQAYIDMIAQRNQVIIKEINFNEVPEDIQKALQIKNAWFDDDKVNYFKAFSNAKYYQMENDEKNELLIIDEKLSSVIFFTLIGSVALCCFVWLFGLHRKLKLIEQTLISLSEGNLAARAPTKKRLQVGRLNMSLNTMADKMAHLLASHKRLTHIIAHELRSPLFRMQIHLELLDQKNVKDNTAHIQGLEEEIFCLEDMVEELLSYAIMERAELKPSFELIEFNIFLSNLCSKLSSECSSTIHFIDNTDTVQTIEVDTFLVTRGITNLIRNAEKYGNSHIYVSLVKQQGSIKICVEDDGDGINAQQQSQIFEPYYRIENSESTAGFGLGLAIVKEIAQLHYGNVSVSRSNHKGAKFVLTFPLRRK